MKKRGKLQRLLPFLFLPLLLTAQVFAGASPEEEPVFEIQPVSLAKEALPALSAILVDLESGAVLYEKEPDLRLPPASITKIMTMLLVLEAIESGQVSWDDPVETSEHAASMGGSQIFLKVGEVMSVETLYKSVSIASANDASVALAEHVSGSEDVFVAKMNQRAKELGMENTVFKNASGLDEAGHESTARDVAVMSAALSKHGDAFRFTTTWMDSVRDGAFGLVNTNKLVRSYKGITGLKTGSTGRAKYCVSATANRDGMALCAVIMGSDTTAERFSAAAALLDYGYAGFERVDLSEGVEISPLKVKFGETETITPVPEGSVFRLVPRGSAKDLVKMLHMPETVQAPLTKGDAVGAIDISLEGNLVGQVVLVAGEEIPKLSFGKAFCRLLSALRLF